MSTVDSGFTEMLLNSFPTFNSLFSISSRNYSSDSSLKEQSRVSCYQSDSSDIMLTASSSSHSCGKSTTSYSRIGLAIVLTLPENKQL